MDNSIDQMQKTAKAVMIFELREFTPQMRQMGDTIMRCAELVEEAILVCGRSAPRRSGWAKSPKISRPRGSGRRTSRSGAARTLSASLDLRPDGVHHRAMRSTITLRRSSIVSTTSPM